jgi:hypothetical protein
MFIGCASLPAAQRPRFPALLFSPPGRDDPVPKHADAFDLGLEDIPDLEPLRWRHQDPGRVPPLTGSRPCIRMAPLPLGSAPGILRGPTASRETAGRCPRESRTIRGLVRRIIVPLEIPLGVLSSRFDQGILHRVAQVEVRRFDPQGVDVNRSLPVIAVQMLVVLDAHDGFHQAPGVGEEVVDLAMLGFRLVAEYRDLPGGIQAKPQGLLIGLLSRKCLSV